MEAPQVEMSGTDTGGHFNHFKASIAPLISPCSARVAIEREKKVTPLPRNNPGHVPT
jgi:hypothetical protein